MKFIHLKQGSAEWLEWRRKVIGASDAPVIMGHASLKRLEALLEDKISGKRNEPNAAMRRGTEMEETARQCFEKKMGLSVFPCCVEHRSIPWMVASLDGLCPDQKTLVEIKCPTSSKSHDIAKENKVPDYYYPSFNTRWRLRG